MRLLINLSILALASLVLDVSWRTGCSPVCEEAIRQLRQNRTGTTSANHTEAWNQLKLWVSGNMENCFRHLLNATDLDASRERINESLRKHVFSDGSNATTPNNATANCNTTTTKKGVKRQKTFRNGHRGRNDTADRRGKGGGGQQDRWRNDRRQGGRNQGAGNVRDGGGRNSSTTRRG